MILLQAISLVFGFLAAWTVVVILALNGIAQEDKHLRNQGLLKDNESLFDDFQF